MRINDLNALSRRPPSEVEWEDLLVRIELMPRALRVHLENVDPLEPVAEEVLAELVSREEWVRGILERAANLAERTGPSAAERTESSAFQPEIFTSQLDRLERFVRRRTRNFAIVQRRGINVWDWEAPVGSETVTVYQLFTYLARADVAALASLRGVSPGYRSC